MKTVLLSLMILLSFNSAHASSVTAYITQCWIVGADRYFKMETWPYGRYYSCSADVEFQSDDVLNAVATGEITPEEAKALLQKINEQSVEPKSSN